jgi:hypothetical protein
MRVTLVFPLVPVMWRSGYARRGLPSSSTMTEMHSRVGVARQPASSTLAWASSQAKESMTAGCVAMPLLRRAKPLSCRKDTSPSALLSP